MSVLRGIFEIPWIMVCDNDDAGRGFIKQVNSRGLTNGEIKKLVQVLPGENTDLELFLVKNGFMEEYIQILEERHTILTKKHGEVGFENEIASKIRTDKVGYAILLIEKLRTTGVDSTRVLNSLLTS